MNKQFAYLLAVSIVAVMMGLSVASNGADIAMNYKYATYGYSSSQRFSKPSGVFYDAKRDELYVADTGNGQIVILDKKGMPVGKIPHYVMDKGSDKRHFGEPRSVVVAKNGDILIADNLCNYIDIFDFNWHSIRKLWIGELLGLPKEKVQPRCLAIDSAGNVYVGVTGGDSEIIVLTPDLKLKTKMGDGSDSLTGLWVDKEGRIYATYAMGACVRAFSPDGKQIVSFGSHESGPQNFSLPSGLISDQEGRFWVVDTLRCVVTVFRPDVKASVLKYTFISMTIGGMGQASGDLAYPSAIASDGLNRIYVVESVGARVQAFELTPGTAPNKTK